MICPKCLTLETEGSLKCRKCGAQLYTGVFQKPVVPAPEERPAEKTGRPDSLQARVIALAVFALVVVVLVLLLSRLESVVP